MPVKTGVRPSTRGTPTPVQHTQPRIAVVDDPRFDAHRARGHHPECPERLDAARSGLLSTVPETHRVRIAARPVRTDEAERVHGTTYLSQLADALSRGSGHLDPDTYFSPGSREAAWAAAGGAAELARTLLVGDVRRGVALLRPPGHHARPGGAMGFCMLNNVAIAATVALEHGAERVCIVDWDVHHGNGTQDRFFDDPRVLFISLHQWPFYPGSGRPEEVGAGEGQGRTVNVALPAGSGPGIYGEAFRQLVLPLLDAFGADLTLVSAGFDGHTRDPLASLDLDTPTYAAMTTALALQAERAGHGRLGLILEGGYDLAALEESIAAVGHALLGHGTDLPEVHPRADERRALERTIERVAPHWPGIDLGPER
jgi:acetoin utilization deacetylase AcuC-like enzyme